MLDYNEATFQGDLGGLYTSTDGGIQWRRETFAATGNYWCHSVVFHPTRRGVIFATMTARGTSSGIYRTTDGGATWEQFTRGLPSSEIDRADESGDQPVRPRRDVRDFQ